MPAPKGNRFWEARTTHGRKKKFNSASLWKGCLEYFDWVEKNPLIEIRGFAFQGKVTKEEFPKMRAMTIGGLCIFLDIDQSTWGDYRGQKDFSLVITRTEEIIRTQKFAGAAAELLNPNIIARDLGLSDKKELTGAGGGPIHTTNQFVFNPVGPDYERNKD